MRPFPSRPRKERSCYENAVVVAALRNGYEYVEGFSMVDVPVDDHEPVRFVVHHAWNYDPGNDVVVDASWEMVATEYLGIVFPFDYLLDSARRTGWFGIMLADEVSGYDLLTRGLPGIDY